MFKIIKYSFIQLLRTKSNLFWVVAFPIALGTLFYVAFNSIGELEAFHSIPVAVVAPDDAYGQALKEVMESMAKEDNPMMVATFVDAKEADELLKSGEVVGTITGGEKATLEFSSSLKNKETEQSILEIFVQRYNGNVNLIKNVAINHPEDMGKIIKEMSREVTYGKEVSIQKSTNVNTYTQYFYNQLAMACLFAAGAGVIVACRNQGNLSALAARKNVSSTKKAVTILCELVANTVLQFLLNLIGYFYLAFVLKVGVEVEMGYAILALFAGVFLGVSLGYLIGSIGRKDEDFKQGMVFAITLPLCFASGLMIADIRMLIERHAPWINRINPPALISDCFYSLAIFEGYDRYFRDLTTIFVLGIVFIGTGLVLTRRTTYASL